MNKVPRNYRLLLFFLILSMMLPLKAGWAASREEMQVLEMYFQTKDLIVTTTRNMKPLSQVAENVTVITAEEIRQMNAHTVAEILNHVPGIFISFNRDFGASSFIQMQGSENYHTLVLLDGIQWNFLADGGVETNNIPVGIIERIEIVKGPASSSWGSSLGGVVNIITKHISHEKKPSGTLYAAVAERNTRDIRTDYAGNLGETSYYVYAGRRESDGLRGNRSFDDNDLYTKFRIPASNKLDLTFSMGYSEPDMHLGDIPDYDLSSSGNYKTVFGAGALDTDLSENLRLSLGFHALQRKTKLLNEALGLGYWGDAGDLVQKNVDEESQLGGCGKLALSKGPHAVTLGMDINFKKSDDITAVGQVYQGWGVPSLSTFHPDRQEWAVYVNDTICFNRWSLTPGIRYDHDSIAGSFVSPSIGITFQADKDTIVRAAAARGFTSPSFADTSIGGLFLVPNPDLDPEEVWSFQTGLESNAFKFVWSKTTFFYHRLDNAFQRKIDALGPFQDMIVNSGASERRGIEFEMQTVPYHHISCGAGISYVHYSPPSRYGASDSYSYHIKMEYDEKENLHAQLFGHFLWWDFAPEQKAAYDDFIWDLNISKRVLSCTDFQTDLFATAHNLFNGSQYSLFYSKNPKRWIEIGTRIAF